MEDKLYCRSGQHLLSEVGKTNDGRCRQCTKEAARRTYLKHHESRLERLRSADAARREKLREEAKARPIPETCKSGRHYRATSGVTRDGRCLECSRAASRRAYEKHREERLAKQRRAYLKIHKPELLERIKERDQKRASYDKERIRGLRRNFGMTLTEYSEMLLAQNGVCAICKLAETDTFKGSVRPLAVDHHHVTNQRRSLLCAKCNRGLGMFRDNPDLLIAAAEYLKKWTH